MRRFLNLALITIAACGLLAAQETPKAAAANNRLVTGKLMYVGQMPEGLANWIMQDLKDWGRYKPTVNSEGVDLVMKSYTPRKYTQYKEHHGIPMPKEIHRKKGHEKPPVATIVVTNWITGDPLWSADIVDRKPKKDEDDAKPGDSVKIYARGMSNEELASRITDALRAYVEHLAPSNAPRIAPLRHSPN